jgi:heptosyltransferase-1
MCENLTLHSQNHFRLLVVRLGAMGDILHALPAVTALRLAHPEWEIGWVVEPRWSALLEAGTEGRREQGTEGPRDQGTEGLARGVLRPVVDQVHLAPAKAWGKQPFALGTMRGIAGLRRVLRACRYDAVLDLQGAIKSAVVARMAGAARTIGEESPRERPARWLFTERVATRGGHVIEQDLELAGAIMGEALAWAQPMLPEDPGAEAWCDALLAGATHIAELGSAPVAMLTPGAGWGAKRWPVERYAEVARGLVGRGMRVLVNSGPGEEAMAREIERGTDGAALPVEASIAELIALVRRLALFVGGDTGPLHLACALGRPVVGIYGPTDPGRNGPFGTRFRVLRSPTSVRDHSRRAEPEAGLLTITPEAVLRAADELLGKEEVR